MQAVRKDLLWV